MQPESARPSPAASEMTAGRRCVPDHDWPPQVTVRGCTCIPLASESDGIEDHFVGGCEAGSNLDRVAEIVADGDRHKLDAVAANDADAKALGAEQQRVGRNRNCVPIAGRWKWTKTYAPGRSTPLELSTSTSTLSVRVDWLMASGVAHDGAGNFQVRVGILCQRCVIAVMDRVGVHFRHRDIDAEPIGRIHVKQFAWIVGPGTGINEVADICVARGNDAVKRRNDALVALQLFEAANVGPAGIHRGLRGDVISAGLVGLLLRNGVLGQQCLPAVAGHAGQVRVGLHTLQLGARLVQLLVYLGRLDLGEEIALCARARQCRSTTSSGSRWCESRLAYR